MTPRGFTLIELLVVIAIIGILASIVLTSLSSVRMKANDTRRISDIKNIATAMEMYNNDHGAYPVGSYNSRSATSWSNLQTLLTSYMSGGALPVDPANGSKEGIMCSNCAEYDVVSATGKFSIGTYLAMGSSSPYVMGGNLYGSWYMYAANCTATAWATCN